MSTTALLILVLIILMLVAAPRWGYSRNWGYAPSSVMGLLLLIFLILIVLGKL